MSTYNVQRIIKQRSEERKQAAEKRHSRLTCGCLLFVDYLKMTGEVIPKINSAYEMQELLSYDDYRLYCVINGFDYQEPLEAYRAVNK